MILPSVHALDTIATSLSHYAGCLDRLPGVDPARGLGMRFRLHVAQRFSRTLPAETNLTELLADTLSRAVALAGWRAWTPAHLHERADEIDREHDALRATHCRTGIDAIVRQPVANSRISRVLNSGTDVQPLLDQLRDILQQTATHLDQRSRPSPLKSTLPASLHEASDAVERALAALPANGLIIELCERFADLPIDALPRLLESPREFLGPMPLEIPEATEEYLRAEAMVRMLRIAAENPLAMDHFPIDFWSQLRDPLYAVAWWPRSWDGPIAPLADVPKSPTLLRESLRLLVQDVLLQSVTPSRLQRLFSRTLMGLLTGPHACTITPAIDPQSLRPIADTMIPAQLAIEYRPDDAPYGTVLQLDRFADAQGPGSIIVSLGPDAVQWARWLELPKPPGLPAILTETIQQVADCVRQPSHIDPTTRLRERFRAWLATDVGGDWLNASIQSARTGDFSEQTWLTFLIDQGWLICFPAIDFETGSIRWPDDVPFPPTIVWEFADSALASILSVERFANTPERACLTLSQGPRIDGTPLTCLVDLAEWVTEPATNATAWAKTISVDLARLRSGELPGVLMGGIVAYLDHFLTLVPGTNWLRVPPDQQPRLNRGLLRLRAFVGSLDCDVLPIIWQFDIPGLWSPTDLDRVEATFAYRPDEPRGRIFRIRRFGLCQGDCLIQSAQVSVSVGIAPRGLTELEDVIKQPIGPLEESLRQRLREWRSASLNETLEMTALNFYADYWDHHFDLHAIADRERANAFADRLRDLLNQEFGFQAFYPTLFQEQPDGWIEIPEGTRMRTGRVMRVLRPGLVDREGQLMLPARVEVE